MKNEIKKLNKLKHNFLEILNSQFTYNTEMDEITDDEYQKQYEFCFKKEEIEKKLGIKYKDMINISVELKEFGLIDDTFGNSAQGEFNAFTLTQKGIIAFSNKYYLDLHKSKTIRYFQKNESWLKYIIPFVAYILGGFIAKYLF
ncbi:MAG: hypothetical protein ABIJ97_08630 [Bacteroidota bacterium]